MSMRPEHSDFQSVADRLDAETKRKEQGNWVPANGGTETPFRSRLGIRMLYVWQPSTGRHAYLNLDTDTIMEDDEAMLALGVT